MVTEFGRVLLEMLDRKGLSCYEIGEDVAGRFRQRRLEPALTGDRLDLAASVRLELERAGALPERVLDTGLCTSCHPELFFSHRRDGGSTGRQAGLAWLEP